MTSFMERFLEEQINEVPRSLANATHSYAKQEAQKPNYGTSLFTRRVKSLAGMELIGSAAGGLAYLLAGESPVEGMKMGAIVTGADLALNYGLLTLANQSASWKAKPKEEKKEAAAEGLSALFG